MSTHAKKFLPAFPAITDERLAEIDRRLADPNYKPRPVRWNVGRAKFVGQVPDFLAEDIESAANGEFTVVCHLVGCLDSKELYESGLGRLFTFNSGTIVEVTEPDPAKFIEGASDPEEALLGVFAAGPLLKRLLDQVHKYG